MSNSVQPHRWQPTRLHHPWDSPRKNTGVGCHFLLQFFDQQFQVNTLEGINSRITEAEERINDLKDRMVEITATEQNIEKRMKRNENSLRDFSDNIKRTNISITGVPEEERKDLRKYLKR